MSTRMSESCNNAVTPKQQPSNERSATILNSPAASAGVLVAIVIVGMGIRAYRLTDRSMWFDESSSWRTSQLTVPELLVAVAKNNHVPLHYLLLKAWTLVFGDSLWAMRGMSVLLSGMAMVGVYLFASEAFKFTSRPGCGPSEERARWIGLFSAALLAVSLMQIQAAWEVRMYTLGTALVALSSWTLFRGLHATNNAWRSWVLHGFVTFLLIYTHNYAEFSIAGQLAFLIGYFLNRWRRDLAQPLQDPQFKWAVVSYATVALGWGAWLPILLRQTRQVQEYWWRGSLGPWGLPHRCYEMFFEGPAGDFASLIPTAILVAVLVVLVWKAGPGEWYVLCLAVVPYCLGAAVSFVIGRNVFILRYLVFAQLFLLIAFAVLVSRIRDRLVRGIVAMVLLVNCLALDVDAWLRMDIVNKPGLKGAVEYIEANWRPGEQVVVCSPSLYFAASYYFVDRSRCHLFNDGTPLPHNTGGPFVVPSDLISTDRIAELRSGRIWLICGGAVGIDLPRLASWQLSSTREFKGVAGYEGNIVVEMYEIQRPDPNQ
jgi:mannosyltransferase